MQSQVGVCRHWNSATRGEQESNDPSKAGDEEKPEAHKVCVLPLFTWSFMEPRHTVIERGSLKRLYVYSNRDMDRGRRQERETEKKE